MKALIKVMLTIAIFFACTFILIKLTGVLSLQQIEGWLSQAREISPWYVGSIVALLLFADLFIAVPTLTVSILAGYFLGHTIGAIAALSGVCLAGIVGYLISRQYGNAVLEFLVRNESSRQDVILNFKKHGFVMIILSRALPILPETTACLSGMTRMPFTKFLFAWLISAVPYIVIATYAGSISSIENPKPAIYTAITISSVLWFLWFVYHRVRIQVKE